MVTQAELRGQQLPRRGGAHRGVDRRGDAHDAGRGRAARIATARCCPARTCRWRCRSTPSDALTIPTNTLMFRGDGTRVAVVDGAGKVQLRR